MPYEAKEKRCDLELEIKGVMNSRTRTDSPMMKRRYFLGITTAGAAVVSGADFGLAAAPVARQKAPFRVLYSNDLTHITSCISPYHKAREPFRKEMLEASVDEVAGIGVDAHFLQPGLGMVPLWPSKVLPVEEHYRWVKERYGLGPDSYGRYVLAGGDIVKVFIDRCRKRGQAAFISLRLNDVHQKEFAGAKLGDKLSGSAAMALTRFYVEHPEWRVGPDPKRGPDVAMNWAIPEVRAQKFALLQELCENYDLDGFELDFMRFYSFFPSDTTTSTQRTSIMTGFVRQVRELLDRTARAGRRRWLCARVPCYVKGLDPLGLDLAGMVETGLDMVNVSTSYFTMQQTDFAALRKMAPQAAMYLELCHSIWNGGKVVPGYDTFTFRRTSPEQYYTAAHLAYARGADGVSTFNFPYYREHGGPGRGPFHEPPFEVFKHLGDTAWLARQPQHWFVAPGWNNPFLRPPTLPRKLEPGKTTTFTLDLAPPVGGWKRAGRLRIQGEGALGDGRWQVLFNGIKLMPATDVSEPFPNPYPVMLGKPEEMRAWTVPAEQLQDGHNQVEIKLNQGKPASLVYLDLMV